MLTAGMLTGYGLTPGGGITIGLWVTDRFGAETVATSTIRMTSAPAVPEPTSLALFGLGAAGLAVRRGRRRSA